MSSSTAGTEGAASAAPSLDSLAADLAELEAKLDESPELRYAIRAGEKLTEAKALLGRGEWSPWLREHFTRASTVANDFMRLAEAHAENSLLHLGSIREALDALPKKATANTPSSTAGVSRPRASVTSSEVIDWVAGLRKKGVVGRDSIVVASKVRGDYPGDRPLSTGSVSLIDAVLFDRETYGRSARPAATNGKAKGPTWGGRARRKIHEEIRAQGASKLRELRIKITEAVMGLEHYVLPEDVDLNDETQDDIGMLVQYLSILSEWTDDAITATNACLGDLDRQRVIAKLRAVAEHPTTGEHERRGARLAIKRMEASYRAKQLTE